MTIRLVASEPVGAPFAMSTLGAGARSLRAPAMPSMVGLPSTGSKRPGWVTGPATGVGFDQFWPPLVEADISSKLPLPDEELVPMPKTYAVPSLPVRRATLLLTLEPRPAHVDVAEERARGCVVGPDLLIVGEGRAGLSRDDD